MTGDILRLSDADVTALSPEELNAISEEELSAMQVRALNSAPQTSLTPTMPAFPLDVFPPGSRTMRVKSLVPSKCRKALSVLHSWARSAPRTGTHLQIVLKRRYVRFCHDYFFLVADASIGKSGVFSYLSQPLYQIQRELRNRAEADQGTNDDRPAPRPQVVISDATPEAMLKVQYENGGAASMVSPETPLFAQLSGTGGKEWSIAPYNSSHTGEPYQVDRIMRGQNDIERARLAIITATQPETLKLVHNRPHLESSGFLSRCTFYMCPVLTAGDLSPEDPEVTEELAERYETDGA